MKYFILFIVALMTSSHATSDQEKYNEDTIKIAVVDTGFDFNSDWKKFDHMFVDKDKKLIVKPKLCNEGHKDFTDTGLKDNHGHGTHVAGIIAKYAGNSNYCLVIIKTYDKSSVDFNSGVEKTQKAFNYARRIGVDIINYSGGGEDFNIMEYLAIKKALDSGIIVVAAAGNEGKEINSHVLKVDIKFKYIGKGKTIVHKFKPYYINRETSEISTLSPNNSYYPAAYDPRIIGVVNIDRNGKVVKSSNRGDAFSFKELGKNVLSIMPNNSVGSMTGTSQSTAVKTGKIIKSWGK